MLKTIILLSLLSLCHGSSWGWENLEGDSRYTTPATEATSPLCPENGNAVSMIPSETECAVFYICYAGLQTEKRCEDGEEFDPEILGCAAISSSGCSSRTTAPRLPNSPFQCPNNDSEVTVHADQDFCYKFHICFQGVISTYECIEGYEYDEEKQLCVPISDDGCTASKSTTTPSPTRPSPPPSFICPVNSSNLSMIPDETFCDKFYVCFEGNVIAELECGSGDEFDETVQDCVPISNMGCTASKTSTVVPTTRPPFVCPTDDHYVNVYGDDQDCAVFYMCFGGIAYEFTCESGFEFNSTTLGCAPISADGCTAWKTSTLGTTSPAPFQCPNNDYVTYVYPDQYGCTKYYMCSLGSYTQGKCDEGKEWSTTKYECVPIGPGGCTDLQQNPSTVAMNFLD